MTNRALLILSCSLALRAACPVDRGAERTASDAESAKVNAGLVQDLSVSEFLKLPRPAGTLSARTAGAESTIYRIKGTLVASRRDAEEGVALTLLDASGASLTAVIPSPTCVTAGPFRDKIRDARLYWSERFPLGAKTQALDLPATVAGLGFFTATGITLQPVIAVEVGQVKATSVDPLPSARFVYIALTALMTVLYLMLLAGSIFSMRKDTTWSLALALSENGSPSTSRLIAFLGMQAMLVMYIGGGQLTVWRLFNGQEPPDLTNYFLVGLSLFAPYAVSQFRQGVQSILPVVTAAAQPNVPAPAPPAAAAPTQSGTLVVTPAPLRAGKSNEVILDGSGFHTGSVILLLVNGVAKETATARFESAARVRCTLTPPASAVSYMAEIKVTIAGAPGLLSQSVTVEP